MTCRPLGTSRQLQSFALVFTSTNVAFQWAHTHFFYLYIFPAFVFHFLIKAVLNRWGFEGRSPFSPCFVLKNSLFFASESCFLRMQGVLVTGKQLISLCNKCSLGGDVNSFQTRKLVQGTEIILPNACNPEMHL